MKALVKFDNKPGAVEIHDVPIPEIGRDDVLLETKAVGVCGFDLEIWQQKIPFPITVPVIQGHEFCGIIHKVGAEVNDFAEGDRVVSETCAVICGKCPQCLTGHYHLCAKRKGFGYGTDGAFTDYVKVPRRCLHRMPDNVSFDHAAMTEPACVTYQAVNVLSTVMPGTPAIVIGPGPIGLFALQMLKANSAGPVIVVGTDKDMQRLEVATSLSADVTINVSKMDARQAIMDYTHGYGAPLVVDAAGNEHALRLAVDVVAREGQITKIGWGPGPVNFSLDPLLTKAARIQGSFSHNWPTWEAVISMIAAGTLKMEPMISHRIAIDQWEETFQAIHDGRGVKAVMLFNQN
jgi:alcohol dehydrogenase/L-iditol 2-dehydrogenase